MIITGSGSWSPLVFLLCIIVISLIVYLIRSLGERECRKEKDKTAAFFSGNQPLMKNKVTNIYWGFFEALSRYYGWMEKIHNGIVNDYIYWFVLVVIIISGVVIFL